MMGTIETLNASEAAEYLRSLGMSISPTSVRAGLKDRRFPFGDFIPSEDRGYCIIYKRLLQEWAEERITKE